MIHALLLLAALNTSDAPKDDSPAPCEVATLTPLDVCNSMTAAAKSNDFDTLLGHSTVFVRTHFGKKEKLAIEGLHNLLVGVLCVRITSEDDAGSPPRSLVWVYAPENKSRDLPFVREHGFWRFDYVQYEAMHGKQAK